MAREAASGIVGSRELGGRGASEMCFIRTDIHEEPENGTFLYNLACAESHLGRKQEALEHLRQAVEKRPELAGGAVRDSDLDAIRDEPEFSAITGQAGTAGAGS